ncbi:MAG: CPBP family intramembrane metalloprotease [Elusimicrobia bacterium]|nr:CPBP family intramembrane metalloprotease [Elusimicrobiota bacterium]MDE2426835.1 CPBP family intramembrane metalloprotease [Elusimicrobiota bacterium]
MAVAAADYGSFYLGLVTILSAVMLLSAHAIYIQQRASVRASETQDRVTPRKFQGSVLGVVVALISFVGAWVAAPAAFGLPQQAVTELSLQADAGTVLSVDVVFGVVQAISEEVFFRFAIVNKVAQWFRRTPALAMPTAIVASAVFFWIFHLPRYWADPRAQALILVSGAVCAYVDFRTGMVLTSILAHMIWNLAASGALSAAAVAHPGTLTIQVLPSVLILGLAAFRGRKGGKPHPITPPKGTLYQEAENQSLAEDVHARSREDAEGSADRLMEDFRSAMTEAHRKEVWRATQEESNRLEAGSRNFRNSAVARSRLADEHALFQARADAMHRQLQEEGAFGR